MSRETILIPGLGLASILFAMSLASWLSAPAPGPMAPPAGQPAAMVPGTMAPGTMAPGGGMPDEAAIRQRVLDLRDRLMADPNDVEGWRMLGRSHMALGEYREAVEAWSWVRELAPNDPQAAAALEELRRIAQQGGRHPAVNGRSGQ
jgi:cytochrome c-type biogenesis protein CcmH/NrfG